MAGQYEMPRAKKLADPRGMVEYIRETAKKYKIDPEVALRVAKSEGLTTFQSSVVKKGVREPSWGAFQLYTGGGLGNDFQKEKKLDPSDPANEKETIDYALKYASQHGWGKWHGAKNTGIGEWEGIGTGGGSTNTASVSSPEGAPETVDTARAPAQYETNPSTTAETLGKGFGDRAKDAVGDTFADLGKIYAQGAAQNAARGSTPANAPLPAMPIPAGVLPTVDPRQAEMQRQQLAMALQRLNSGRLF